MIGTTHGGAHSPADPTSDLHGIRAARVHWNSAVATLYEAALRRGEGIVSAAGALVCRTGTHTGRSPLDKFVVDHPEARREIWWGSVNRPLSPASAAALERDVVSYLEGREVFVQDCVAGADPAHAMPVRVITEHAWHSLFARSVLLTGVAGRPAEAPLTIIDAPGFRADPSCHGTRSETCIVIDLERRLVLIGGTAYAGEIKKSVFTAMNYFLPRRDVLPMHCSANVGPGGDVALFFGLSGTGKTTLSSDPARHLVGDDEHGWSDRGVFNIEGGCYAKLIRLSAEAEPQIHAATSRFGAVLENVACDPLTREPDFDDGSVTENTRGAYPLHHIERHVPGGQAGHPRTIVMLTADAFGVMPPIARLTPAQAMYHFLSGYTARVAGTERGVTEPVATFSACFGAPFLPLPPAVYARALGERIARHGVRVWLVNTGWTGGPYGTGHRMPIAETRALVHGALSGALDDMPGRIEPYFGLHVPAACHGVPREILDPRGTWADPQAYDAHARRLAAMFRENFTAFLPDVGDEVRAAGPPAA